MTPRRLLLTVILAATLLGSAALAFIPPITGSVEGAAIKTWGSGETLTSTDLNANFQHIHNNMVGGHGGRLVDADVSNTAAIKSSKLADGKGIAKAYVEISSACGGATCAYSTSLNVSSVTRSAAGTYVVNLNYTPTDASYAVFVVQRDVGLTFANPICGVNAHTSAGAITIVCRTIGCAANPCTGANFTGTGTDTIFGVLVYDDN